MGVSTVPTWFTHGTPQKSGASAGRRSTVSCSVIAPSSVVEATNSKLMKGQLYSTACFMASKIFTIAGALTGEKDPSRHSSSCILFVNGKRVPSL